MQENRSINSVLQAFFEKAMSDFVMSKLPKDVWFEIFNYLSTKSLLNFSATCANARNFLMTSQYCEQKFASRNKQFLKYTITSAQRKCRYSRKVPEQGIVYAWLLDHFLEDKPVSYCELCDVYVSPSYSISHRMCRVCYKRICENHFGIGTFYSTCNACLIYKNCSICGKKVLGQRPAEYFLLSVPGFKCKM